MNAKQRRTANRTLDALVGKKATFVMSNGRESNVTIISRTVPVIELGSIPTNYAFDGSRPSLHRVRCRRDGDAGTSTLSPRLSQLRIERKAA